MSGTIEGSKLVNAEIAKLEADALVELFVLDASEIGGEVFYFHAGTNRLTSPVVYLGQAYYPIPVQLRGIEYKGQGELPRPHITFSNIGGFMKNLVLLYEDLVGATIIRRRVFAKFLDGQPQARPDRVPDDVFMIDRKVSETKFTVEFELGTAFEVQGVFLPRRQIMSGICSFHYRGDGCFFAQKRVVATFKNAVLGEASRYVGDWNSDTSYKNGVAVTEVMEPYNKIYVALSANKGYRPSDNPDKWSFKQRIRGLYDSDSTYSIGDVVWVFGLRKPELPFFFIAHTPVSTGKTPPNKDYWTADECSKNSPGCALRHDPLTQRLALPFGGFPGTVRIPDTI